MLRIMRWLLAIAILVLIVVVYFLSLRVRQLEEADKPRMQPINANLR